MGSSSRDWRKWLLAGGLLLVLACGLLQVPEVRGWYSPEFVWENKVQQLQMEGPKIEAKLKRAEATLETFNDSPGKIPSAKSRNARLHQVQKDCISVNTRTRYLNAKLAALRVALESKIRGESPEGALELTSLLVQVKEMQLQGLQYGLGLEYTLKKLQAVKMAQANQKSGRAW